MSERRVPPLSEWALRDSAAPLHLNGMTIHREHCYQDAKDSPLFEPEMTIEVILADEVKRDAERRRPFFHLCHNCMIYRPGTWVVA